MAGNKNNSYVFVTSLQSIIFKEVKMVRIKLTFTMYVILLIPTWLNVFSSFVFSQSNLIYKGVSYTSWTKGEYPHTTSWKPQTWRDSQAITSVAINTSNLYEGKGSLEIQFNIQAGHPNISKGEVFVDLRFYPPLFEPPFCEYAPFDLFQKTVTAKVHITPEMYNPDTSHPNGLQLFFKSIDKSDPNIWWSFYGTWHNIYSSDMERWKPVSAVPDTTTPFGGYMDPLFDPHAVVAVGLKFGTGDGSNFVTNGKFWMDNFTWSNGIEPKYGFENIENSLQVISDINANYVSVLVTRYMDDFTSVEIEPDSLKTHSDDELIALVDSLHRLDINVMLKPHVDVQDGTWRGLIQPSNIEQWFSSTKTLLPITLILQKD